MRRLTVGFCEWSWGVVRPICLLVSVLVLVLYSHPVHADFSVCGSVGTQTWVSGEVVTATCDVSVVGTLTIEPNVTIKMDPGTSFIIASGGDLQVQGTSGQEVRFTSNQGSPACTDWQGLEYQPSSTGLLDYAIIEYGVVGISIDSASPTIQNSIIQNLCGADGSNGGLDTDGGDGQTTVGIKISGSGAPLISNNRIQNLSGGLGGNSGNGSNGTAGADGADGESNSNSCTAGANAGHGGSGGFGGTGGRGGDAFGIYVENSAAPNLIGNSIQSLDGNRGGDGGQGGNGAAGGEGGQGGAATVSGPGCNGGNGGHGGSAGSGGNGSLGGDAVGIFLDAGTSASLDDNTISILSGGLGGSFGNPGSSASPGYGSDGGTGDSCATSGDGGNGGHGSRGGSGGRPGDGGSSIGVQVLSAATVQIINTEVSNLVGRDGSGGGAPTSPTSGKAGAWGGGGFPCWDACDGGNGGYGGSGGWGAAGGSGSNGGDAYGLFLDYGGLGPLVDQLVVTNLSGGMGGSGLFSGSNGGHADSNGCGANFCGCGITEGNGGSAGSGGWGGHGGDAAGVFVSPGITLNLQNALLFDFWAADGGDASDGGACGGGGPPSFCSHGAWGGDGGHSSGIMADNATVNVQHATITNMMYWGVGGAGGNATSCTDLCDYGQRGNYGSMSAVYLFNTSTGSLSNSIFVGSSPVLFGSFGVYVSYNSSTTLTTNDVWGNEYDYVNATPVNDLNVDPEFVDSGPGKIFHLEDSSPLNAAGTASGVAFDLNDRARLDPPTIGAYERIPDSDGDGLPDEVEGTGDSDGDTVADYLDLDSDNDGLSDAVELDADPDSDSLGNYLDVDSDGDGVFDLIESNDANFDGINDNPIALDVDSNGRIDTLIDLNGDGWEDSYDPGQGGVAAVQQNTDGTGGPDWQDTDDDQDGVLTENEDSNGNSDWSDDDFNQDGVPNYLDGDNDHDGIPDITDPDDDNDWILDNDETPGDFDSDGIPNNMDDDADGDGAHDRYDCSLLDSSQGGAVTDLELSDTLNMSWQSPAPCAGQTYDVASGTVSELKNSTGQAVEMGFIFPVECNDTELSSQDPFNPGPGELWYYVVREFDDEHYGLASDGSPRSVWSGGCP